MNSTVDLVVVNDCVDEAEQICFPFEEAGLTTAMALGPVSAAQALRLSQPRLVLMVNSRLAGDDACAVLKWLRPCSEGSIFGCLLAPHAEGGSKHYMQSGFDFCFRLPLSAHVVFALAESVKAVRQRFGAMARDLHASSIAHAA